MKTTLQVSVAAWVLLAISTVWAGSSQEKVLIVDNGVTTVVGSSPTRYVKLEIRTGRIPGRLPYIDEEDLNRNISVTVIEKITAVVDGHRIFVPPSVFADLEDPRYAVLRFDKKQMVLILSGGDAANSYVVHMYFDSRAVRRRTLASAILPSPGVTEETRYWVRVLRDK